MTATRTTRPREPIDRDKTDKTAASHGCQWETNNNSILGGGFKYFLFSSLPGEMVQFDSYFSNGLKPPTSIPSHFTIFHYHAHHHSLAPSHHHPSAYTYEPPVSVIIHHHPSLSVIIYQDWSPSIIIHFPFISIYHHPWSYIIVHRRPFIFIHIFLSWFINIYYHPPSSITHHHPSSSNNIHHDPLWTTIIHYHQSSSIMNHHHTSSIIIHHHPPSFIHHLSPTFTNLALFWSLHFSCRMPASYISSGKTWSGTAIPPTSWSPETQEVVGSRWLIPMFLFPEENCCFVVCFFISSTSNRGGKWCINVSFL